MPIWNTSLSQDSPAQAHEQTEARHKAQVEELTPLGARSSAQDVELIARKRMQLLRDKSVSLAESETRGDELRNRLRQQLKATRSFRGFWMS